MLLTEIVNSPYSYTTDYDSNHSYGPTLSATFTNAENHTITARLSYSEKDNSIGLGFKRNNNPALTGEGDQFRILSTIIDFLKNNINKMFKKHNADTFYFSADVSEESRVKLYRKRAPLIISSILGPEWKGPEEKQITQSDGLIEMMFSWEKKR